MISLLRAMLSATRVLLVRAVMCAVLTLALMQHTFAVGTVVGTIIENTATVEFVFGGFPAMEVSNTTTFLVAERIEVVVTPQSGQVVVLVNESARSLLFTITNTGNGTETFQLAINSIVAGDDFDPIPALPDSIFFDTGAPTVVVRLGDLTLVDGLQTVVFQVTID